MLRGKYLLNEEKGKQRMVKLGWVFLPLFSSLPPLDHQGGACSCGKGGLVSRPPNRSFSLPVFVSPWQRGGLRTVQLEFRKCGLSLPSQTSQTLIYSSLFGHCIAEWVLSPEGQSLGTLQHHGQRLTWFNSGLSYFARLNNSFKVFKEGLRCNCKSAMCLTCFFFRFCD